MMNPKLARNLRNFLPFVNRDLTSPFSSSPFTFHHRFHHFQPHSFTLHNPNSFLSSPVSAHHHSVNLSLKLSPCFDLSFASRSQYSTTTTTASSEDVRRENPKKLAQSDSSDEVEPIDLWEEEDETEPEIGDGGDGGGVVLQNCPWGERVLSIAQDVLLQFGDDIEIFAFKTSPGGYIYVRLDRLCNEYGCPSMEDIQSYSHEYKKRLDEAGAVGDIPSDLALEVSSPGADRLLRIPDDLQRFKSMAMRVKYADHDDPKFPGKEGIFFLESIEVESGSCVWRLADVKENRNPSSKGRPLTRKQKDWRLKLPYEMLEQGWKVSTRGRLCESDVGNTTPTMQPVLEKDKLLINPFDCEIRMEMMGERAVGASGFGRKDGMATFFQCKRLGAGPQDDTAHS